MHNINIIPKINVKTFFISFFSKAFLRGTLTQQSSISLVLLAVERYMASVQPFQYQSCITKPVRKASQDIR